MSQRGEYRWWERGVVYQIYPRSFQDSDGDGVGDLRGILGRLDYLRWLGVDALWFSPIYPSPMADFGYDISDYEGIDPVFGTLGDFDALVAAAQAQGLKVILDYVPNHTSDQHPWFLASRSSRRDPRRDWYIWRDPAPGGGPPNNWLSYFGGGAWEYDAATGQYYYHAFLKQQPDLNWQNPEVEQAMLDVLRFWLDRGVDGFRVDTMHHLIKDQQFRDNPPNPDYHPGLAPYRGLAPIYSIDRPEVHRIVSRMREVVDAYEGSVLIGEIYLPVERLITYYGVAGAGAHLPFNFQLIELPWEAPRIAAAVERYESLLPPFGWPNWVLGNHDKPRIATRVGRAQARVSAMLLLTLRGTPTIYYGDEIGMQDVLVPPELAQDPYGKNVPGMGRDPARTPMQWDEGPHAGFSSTQPWLPVAVDYQSFNVVAEQADPGSMLMLYRRLILLRRRLAPLAFGDYRPLTAEGDLLAYLRLAGETRILTVLNLGSRLASYRPPELAGVRGRLLISTYLDREGEAFAGAVELRPDEGVIVELTPTLNTWDERLI